MKKKILTALTLTVCAALLVAGSIFGTVAYLTSQAGVTNVFTFGRVAIDMTESAVDADGQAIAGAARVRANNYKMVPGKTYCKDPVIEILQNSEDLYLFVKVDNQLSAYETTDPAKTLAAQLAAHSWEVLDATNHPGVYVYVVDSSATDKTKYVVAYDPVTATNNKIEVFESFTAKNDFGNPTSTIKDMSIVITAYAVQADGFDTPVKAFEDAGFGTPTTTNP